MKVVKRTNGADGSVTYLNGKGKFVDRKGSAHAWGENQANIIANALNNLAFEASQYVSVPADLFEVVDD